jgi:plasmid stabilization system protein ParE
MARLPIDYHPDARLEADEAFDWYLERSRTVAERFQRELATAQTAIQKSPEAWAEYIHSTRHYLLRRYPYVVVYRVAEERIEIIAIAHGRRKPGYWVDRLGRPGDRSA